MLEPPANALQFFVDDQGVRSVGRTEGCFLFQRYALLGTDDKFLAYLVKSGGDLAGNFGYNLPVFDDGSRLGASFSRGHINVIHVPFQSLDVEGDSTTTAVNASHPLFVDQRWLLLAVGSASYGRSTSTQSRVRITNNDTLKGTAGVTAGYTGEQFAASVSPVLTRAQTQFGVIERGLDFDLVSGTYAASYRFLDSGFQVSSSDHLPGDSLFQATARCRCCSTTGFAEEACAGAIRGRSEIFSLHAVMDRMMDRPRHRAPSVGDWLGGPPWTSTTALRAN